ncbi:hydroxymethylglutaryl-CoA synthase family protein [Neptunitalea lumnitzerae]|uniref:Hydroxymethylglutaryl-CoA synthase n=1 Tax=Neptunitalea lumnitzerae TaxID=2965509 RepID=A0ABQ5MIM2_9FLAO|nr:hydroxymethylglutaryl-CoA synthase [Neptunitalea sp. Y10]GLB49261.1 hydroxymethylglutaryl-CoA synthase [Neptunitalea sp. Y10]
MKIGIDAISFDIPKLQLPIKELAVARNIEPVKLEKGLGLLQMAMPDVHQDVITFAANAITKLVKQENLTPTDIDRIYVGTESGLDASKPIASYLLAILESIFGDNTMTHCDAVDLTFACIGGVDALQNCVDFVTLNPDKKAIVICTDIAKYDLNSTGEYTQGAGAIAMLVAKNPRIISFNRTVATSAKGVFDFFKPHRIVKKEELGITDNQPWQGVLEAEIEIFKEQPVFDGQYSNDCYVERTVEAYYRFKELNKTEGTLYENWKAIVMHLPYSFQARRMFPEIYISDSPELSKEISKTDAEYFTKLKAFSKSETYKAFIAEKFMPAEKASSLIGNMYTGSIFMGLLSTLCYYAESNEDLTGTTLGFLAYGSGAKSKVFEGEVSPSWKEAIAKTGLFETLEVTTAIDIDTYHSLHKKELSTSVLTPSNEWILEGIEETNVNKLGARYYKWVD